MNPPREVWAAIVVELGAALVVNNSRSDLLRWLEEKDARKKVGEIAIVRYVIAEESEDAKV